jgi:integrase
MSKTDKALPNNEQNIVSETEKRQTIVKQSKLPKTDVRHWKAKIFKPVVVRGSERFQSANFAAQFFFQGRRTIMSLDSPNKEVAARTAQDIYKLLISVGWDGMLAVYRPGKEKKEPVSDATIGQYIEEARKHYPKNSFRTFEGYAACLRRVAAEIGKVPNRAKIGQDAWRKRIDQLPLAILTPEAINQWKISYASSKVSLNTILRQCKALFTDKPGEESDKSLLASVREVLAVPEPVPFSQARFIKKPIDTRYISSVNIATLSAKARVELPQINPELYKIFCLALQFGLRRNEIDKLLWKAFRWDQNVLRIGPVKDLFQAKTKASYADLKIPTGVGALFREWQAQSKSEFVIESDCNLKVRLASLHHNLRAEELFTELNKWLRKHGVTGHKPLHTIRKEYGSIYNQELGIHAASIALRHSNISITAAHYVESTPQELPGADLLLNGATNIIPLQAATR